MANFPNFLTALRIFLIPIFIALFLVPSPSRSVWAAIVFVLASLTDLLDGYLARRWKQVTKLGKFLDPVADKLLVLSALILLVEFHRVPAWIVIIIVGREIAVTALRAIASLDGIVLGAEQMGKYKLFIQITAIVLLILDYNTPYLHFRLIGILLLWLSIILTVFSAIQYVFLYRAQLRTKNSRQS